ncbi:transcription repressor OFP14 [Salvia miltiorrhiza]|uniref:transcription repressor OFP14 n=1 Tax=Salvia miltiorrhiza TaxID=226208 RepID=UPI0025ABBFE2|nr:transcription repressor OFP14 [Salvia miltiorrhiza]
MPKQIPKSLQDCLSKLKIPNKQFPLSGCKHVKTTSFAAAAAGKEKEVDGDGVTLTDIDKFLFENFRSLYREEYEEGISRKSAFLLESPRLLEPPPPENLCRSARFFVESGSTSSRITDEPFSSVSSASATNESSSTSEEAEAADGALAPEDFIALLTYSPSPYEDFRRSMQEMVEVRMEHNRRVDWKFLEELLFCYLDLNNKKSYRYILRAFVDVIVFLRENSGKSPASLQPLNGGARDGDM